MDKGVDPERRQRGDGLGDFPQPVALQREQLQALELAQPRRYRPQTVVNGVQALKVGQPAQTFRQSSEFVPTYVEGFEGVVLGVERDGVVVDHLLADLDLGATWEDGGV